MKRKWYTSALCVFLALLICVSWPLKVCAVGEEALLLTRPDIALLILAMFGVVYAIAEGPALVESLEEALRAAPRFDAEDFEYWFAEAEAGLIRLADCPEWISSTIKGWAEGFIKGEKYVSMPVLGADGIPVYNTGDIIGAGSVSYFACDTFFSAVFACDVMKVGLYYIDPAPNPGKIRYEICEMYVAETNLTATLYRNGVETRTVHSYFDELYGPESGHYYPAVDFGSYYEFTPGTLEHKQFLSRMSSYHLIDRSEFPVIYSDYWYNLAKAGSLNTTVVAPHFPSAIVGGVQHALEAGYDMDVINLPNLHLPPVHYPQTGNAEAELEILLQQLAEGLITWEQFLERVAILDQKHGTHYLTIYDEAYYPIHDYGVSPDPVVTLPAPSYSDIDLTKIFPFCIPFDLYEFFSCLAAEPRAPVFNWVIAVPQLGINYPIKIDLSVWNDVAELFRRLELLAFIVGLAVVTRSKIMRS